MLPFLLLVLFIPFTTAAVPLLLLLLLLLYYDRAYFHLPLLLLLLLLLLYILYFHCQITVIPYRCKQSQHMINLFNKALQPALQLY